MATSFDFGQAVPAKAHRDRFMPGPATAACLPFGLAPDHDRSLDRLIEAEIIPRLIVARAPARPRDAAAQPAGDTVTAAEVDDFAPLALQVEADELIAHAERLLARGVSVETLLVDLLAPAARVLGEYWKADRCDFVDVTMALWRLQEVVHEVTARGPFARPAAGPPRRALFAAMPGDQHGFGALLVEEMFGRAGWATDRLGEATLSDLYDRIGGDWFDVIGLTVTCDAHTGALPAAIVALRTVSRNPRLIVLVGGRVFAESPALAETVGADGTAADARGAVDLADRMVAAVMREGLACA